MQCPLTLLLQGRRRKAEKRENRKNKIRRVKEKKEKRKKEKGKLEKGKKERIFIFCKSYFYISRKRKILNY